MRQGKSQQQIAAKSGASFLPLLAIGLIPSPSLSQCLHLQKASWNREVSLTFFSLQLLLPYYLANILLQFLKLTILLTAPVDLCGKICFRRFVQFMHSPYSYCSGIQSRGAPCASLRMISPCNQLLQRLWIYMLSNYSLSVSAHRQVFLNSWLTNPELILRRTQGHLESQCLHYSGRQSLFSTSSFIFKNHPL